MAQLRYRMTSRKGTIMEAPHNAAGKRKLEKIRKDRPATWKGARITSGIQAFPSKVRFFGGKR